MSFPNKNDEIIFKNNPYAYLYLYIERFTVKIQIIQRKLEHYARTDKLYITNYHL